MKRLLLLFFLLLGSARAAEAPPASPQAGMEKRHADKVAAVASAKYDLLMIGDSITHTIGEYGGKYKPLAAVWKKYYAPRNALNLGYSGARTENILWNLQNGELEGQNPKLAVLLIGTNDSDDRRFKTVHTPEEICAGTKAIVDVILAKCPDTKVLILRIFPRGGDAEKGVGQGVFHSSEACTETVRRAGEMTRELADGKRVFWLDVGHVFLNPDGTINTALMPDLLHPNAAGAEAWARAILPTVDRLMENSPAPSAPDLEVPGRRFFSESFESNTWAAAFFDLHGLDEERLSLETDPAVVFRGKSSLKCVLETGNGATASMCHWFAPGYDKVHFRWYCRFEESFDQGNLMHFCGLAAVREDNRWAEMGKAGIRPTGFDRFTTGFEPWRAWGNHEAPGAMTFYSYFPAMKEDPKMKGKFWGNQFQPEHLFVPERKKWHCFEIMVKANTPGQADGEQAAWIDGRLYGYFTGIEWRKSADVRLKRMTLGAYIHENPRRNVVHFDDVVLSTGYIGPGRDD